MKHRALHRAATIIAATFAAAIVFGAPAHADPLSGPSTTVEMPMPGAGQPASGGGASYQAPSVTVAVQDGSGGVDRDGTTGVIDPDGVDGSITGPIMRAAPGYRADAAPSSPHVGS